MGKGKFDFLLYAKETDPKVIRQVNKLRINVMLWWI